ncbi:MAG: hypothetical protein DDT31_01801 [Syntrophomonadaceae bacterium]|nr:hypothetical protein [Bacillota bacterium]
MAMPFSRQIEPSALYEAKGHWEALEAHREQGDKSLVVVVDEAQEMTETMLTELRFAVSHQMDSCSLFPLKRPRARGNQSLHLPSDADR